MNEYTAYRLKKGNEIVAYLAPVKQNEIVYKATIFNEPRMRGKGAIAMDSRVYHVAITLQGTFEHSDNLPLDHRTALQNLFGYSEVTAEMQMRRIYQYAYQVGGTFALYTPDIEFTAATDEEIRVDPAYPADPLRLPQVMFNQIRGPYVAGSPKIEWVLDLVAGLPLREEGE
ncbi:MAG TPA: hypothetical protein PLG75_07850 [Methanoculleus sp.]|nr:hypothetical protein [Methanoculleus sp.]